MKGRTIIELKDAKGKKETYVDHNMITNALATFYQEAGMTNPSAFNTLLKTNPVENLLGGILCLDDTIPESASIVKVPTGIKMIANASWGVLNSGNPSELGSWNESESGWQQDGSYKCVYDFTQSQGNGVIKSVCLTSKLGGLRGIGNASKTSRSAVQDEDTYNSIDAMTGISGKVIGLRNNKLYTVTGYTENGWTLNEYGINVTRTDIRNTKAARLIRSITLQTPAEIIALRNVHSPDAINPSSHYAYYSINSCYQKGDYVYCDYSILGGTSFRIYDYLTADIPIYIVKINLSDFTSTVYATLSPSVVGFSADETPKSGANYHNATRGITDKYFVFRKYLIDLANPTDVTELTDLTQDLERATSLDSDHIQASGFRIDCGGGVALPTNGGHSYIGIGDVNALVHLSDTGYIFRDPSYIASINNLEQAVEKTGDKTMKITYIITF